MMDTTQTKFEEGRRTDVVGRFVSRRQIAVADARVYRLLIEDDAGDLISLLVDPRAVGVLDFLTGERYRFADVLGSDAVSVSVDGAHSDAPGGGSDPGGQKDDFESDPVVAAAVELELADPYGIIDERTAIL